MSNIDDNKNDPKKVRFLLQSYARHISTNVKNTTIMADINEHFGQISEPTFYSYVNALKKLFVIDNIADWSPNIKSKNINPIKWKKQFTDPSIAVEALNLNPEGLYENMVDAGFIFENLCIRDLSVYTSKFGGSISYYHDNSDVEVDCVVHLNDGRYALIECKLGKTKIEEGAQNLLKINKIIEANDEVRNPSFLAVLTGGDVAKTRKDGVKVIPIGCLK